MSLGPRVIKGPTEGARSKENTMAPGPPSWIGPPYLPYLPPPRSFFISKKMQAMQLTTQSDSSNKTMACTRAIRSSCDRMAAEKRRWRRMVPKAKAYLSKAKTYGGGNSDEEGNLPSLPVPGFPSTRPPAFADASAQA